MGAPVAAVPLQTVKGVPPPPPQATKTAAAAGSKNILAIFFNMRNHSVKKLLIGNFAPQI
jgi:hypothetical protein